MPILNLGKGVGNYGNGNEVNRALLPLIHRLLFGYILLFSCDSTNTPAYEREMVGVVSSYGSPESLETTETLPSGGYLQSPPYQTYTPLGGMESPLSLYRTSKLLPHLQGPFF